MKYAYYPGCSLDGGSGAYDQSVRSVCQVLGVELEEIDDWNCCGATEYFTQDRLTATCVVARNLARVGPEHRQVVAPCAACYLNLRKADHQMAEDATTRSQVNEALAAGGLHYDPGKLAVKHLLQLLYDDVGEDGVRQLITRPLEGLRVAPYYGCQIVRPLGGVDDQEYPMHMDEIVGWLGAQAVDYPVKAHCCGGHMTQISEPQALELIRRLLDSARRYEADVIACVCPMCQLNLDLYQGRVNNYFNEDFSLPIVYLTQLVGVAMGVQHDALGLGKEIVPAAPVIERRLSAAAETTAT